MSLWKELNFMEAVKIDNSLLHSHPLWKNAPESLCKIFDRDSDGRNPFVNKHVDCIDVDKIEKDRNKGTNCKQGKTVDAVIGISAIQKEHKCDNTRQLMLVELRMRYDSINQVTFSDWKKKVSHTLSLLGRDIRIRPEYFFVYTNTFYHMVLRKWRDSSKADGTIKAYIPLPISEFYDSCCLPDDWEPKLLVDSLSLEKNIETALNSGSLNSILNTLEYWKKKLGEFAIRNRKNEVNLIKATIVKLLDNAIQSDHEHKEWIAVIIDDFK